jgi:DNA-binding transcriptional MerR regulator
MYNLIVRRIEVEKCIELDCFLGITKTTIKTLRYYDRIGLLKPKAIDKFTNYRYYTTAQMAELYEILSYRQAGLTIEQIKQIVIERKKCRRCFRY